MEADFVRPAGVFGVWGGEEVIRPRRKTTQETPEYAKDLVRRLLEAAWCPRCGDVRDWVNESDEANPVWAEADAFVGGPTEMRQEP